MPERSNIRYEITAFLGALCLFLSMLEYLIPKPLPFFRLGLANLPLLIGLCFLNFKDLLIVLLLKVIGQGLVNGTLASYVFLFSLAGSTASLAAMFLAHKLGGRHISLTGVSLAGAMASSFIQLILAVRFIFGDAARVMAPLFLGSGLVTGLIMGLFAAEFARRSKWLKAVSDSYSKASQKEKANE